MRVVRRLRALIAERSVSLATTVARDVAETLVAEVLPLAEACLFLESEAERILAPRRITRGRPMWLSGVRLEVRREPLGTILIIGPANYPLFLPAVHTLQALVAGNSVLVKPGRGGGRAMHLFRQLVIEAGLPESALTLLGESAEEAHRAIGAGVDKVVLTGSTTTGQAILSALAAHVIPSVMELSGCDSVFVRDDADIGMAANAIRFGLTLNAGNTCIAPKKIYVDRSRASELRQRLLDIPIPLIAVDSDDEAIALSSSCGYSLGASVFGMTSGAAALAARLDAGVVVVNDMIVPTADPRLPFGGRRKSGFGVTRGAEGLLEMTAVKAIAIRRGDWRPHFGAPHPADLQLFQGVVAAFHAGTWRRRLQGFLTLSRAAIARRKAA